MNSQEKYLVTGGAGFIGSHLVEELVNQGQQVKMLDNFITGRESNLLQALGYDNSDINLKTAQAKVDNFELIRGDIRDYNTCRHATEGVDYVLHQAALPSVPRSIQDPIKSNQINVTGTLNLLKAAQAEGVKRFVYASSSSIYGGNPELPQRESLPATPRSPYALQKYTAEKYCQLFHEIYNLETIALRYFNIFGPRQNPDSEYAAVIPKFISRIKDGKPVIIYGDGEQTRDFTYVSNVVEANLLACESNKGIGEAINIGCGDSFTVNELANLLLNLMDSKLEPEHTDPRPGDVRHSQADITNAKELISYNPKVNFTQGLEKTVNFFKQL